jgi:murein DD-endopeptidase MepM/ murein hydrolase activator NlpD
MKLSLWYPIHTKVVSQKFGIANTAPSLMPMYAKLGLLGHNGWDFIAPRGYNIRSAHEGIVTFTGEDGSGGLGVVVRTMTPFEYQGGEAFYKTIYWHCNVGSFKVKPGDHVMIGDVLAEVDSTGMSTGDHLHFALKPIYQGESDWAWSNAEQLNGYYGSIDPEPYWNGKTAYEGATLLQKIAELKKILATLLAKVGK